MIEISQGIIKKATELYKPEYKVLINAQYDFPRASGEYNLSRVPDYAMIDLDYLTIFGTQLSVLQLSYALLIQAFENKDLEKPKGVRDEWNIDCVVRRLDLKFKKKTSTKADFYGEVEIKRVKKERIAEIEFDLNSRSCIGVLEGVLISR